MGRRSTSADKIKRTKIMTLFPRNQRYNFALHIAPKIAPTPLAMKTVPSFVADVLQFDASCFKLDPMATSTIPQTPIAIMYATPSRKRCFVTYAASMLALESLMIERCSFVND